MLPRYQLTINDISFVFINWLEVVYLFTVWNGLKRIEQDQLNIKNELKVTTNCWIAFSLLYFTINIMFNNLDNSDDIQVLF